MRYFAKEMGFAEEEEFWGLVGLLHDIDFEEFPEHCIKAPELLAEISASPEFVHAVVSHGYGLCTQVDMGISWKNPLCYRRADRPHRSRCPHDLPKASGTWSFLP